MSDDEFYREFGMTIDQAFERLKEIKEKNEKSMQAMMDKFEALKFTQPLRSKIRWFENLDRRKRELIRLRDDNKIQ
jgi:hypothetical protein